MKLSNRKTFCKLLAQWLDSCEWHFTTLLSTTIESTQHLPGNTDKLINSLLLSFPIKPSFIEIFDFLTKSNYIEIWFQKPTHPPAIKSFNLTAIAQQEQYFLPNLASIADLADWLNISLGELEWLADLKRQENKKSNKLKHYHYSLIEKRRGGVRLIESPKSLLKEIQRKINSELLTALTIHDAAHGFRANRGIISHAQNHTKKHTLMLFDIEHCFHSIGWRPTYLNLSRLNYAPEITKYLTGLCTHQLNRNDSIVSQLDSHQRKLVLQRHLPQGSPTSPALSNITMHRLDKRLSGLSEKIDLSYSRYADDLAFSTNTVRDWCFLEPLVGSICLEEGFTLNHRKSRVLKSHQRQKLTGVIVNQFPNIDRRYYDNLKAILSNCARYGLESQNRDKHEFFYAHLVGSVNHVLSLNKHKGSKLQKILNHIVVNVE